ncbi:hypothetical protein LQZ19_08810 [Treponema primitia]|uniref:hypothetical protein n=1 Tax=Treponema primitia TaxID=88058 RepID=UPI0039806717
MKVVVTETIPGVTADGTPCEYEVYRPHIWEATVDPEATKAAIAPLVDCCPEAERVKSTRLKIYAAMKTAWEHYAAGEAALNEGKDKQAEAYAKKYQAAQAEAAALQEELQPLIDAHRAAHDQIFLDNPCYLNPGPGQKHITDEEAAALQAQFDALGEHEKLTVTGETIPDWHGVEYWSKIHEVWIKVAVDLPGRPLPEGAILPDDLSVAQHDEINAQTERDRIAALTPAQRAAAKQNALDALADEGTRLERRNQIQRKPFDAVAWYEEKAPAIEAKYA